MNFEKARNLMVENQLRPNKINNPRIFDIFNEIEKEQFLDNHLQELAYSDSDIYLLDNRGYLKNLHIAQLIHYSNIKQKDKILHIGGLTGYVTFILSKLSDSVVVVENDNHLFAKLNDNLSKFDLTNVKIVKSDLQSGYKENLPYDLIFIDCPLNNFPEKIFDQLDPNSGRMLMIKKINNELGKGIRITRKKQTFNQEVLFDSFSKFTLYFEPFDHCGTPTNCSPTNR